MRLRIFVSVLLLASAPAVAQTPDLPPPAPLGGATPSPAPAQPGPAAPGTAFPALGALGSAIAPGPDGGWTVTPAGAGAALANPGDEGAVRYYYVTPPPGTGRLRVETSVVLQPADAGAGAGVLYGFDPAAKTYMAVVLGSGDTVAIYKRGPDGFSELMRSENPGLLRPGANQIVVAGEGASMQIVVNGQEIATISDDMVSADKGVGIVAIGRGVFTFEAWTAS